MAVVRVKLTTSGDAPTASLGPAGVAVWSCSRPRRWAKDHLVSKRLIDNELKLALNDVKRGGSKGHFPLLKRS